VFFPDDEGAKSYGAKIFAAGDVELSSRNTNAPARPTEFVPVPDQGAGRTP
jgi:hypothetical protein